MDSFSGVFVVENDYRSPNLMIASDGNILSSPVYVREISTNFPTTLEGRFQKTRLYLDAYGRYTHTPTATGTVYASYIQMEPLNVPGVGILKRDGKVQ